MYKCMYICTYSTNILQRVTFIEKFSSRQISVFCPCQVALRTACPRALFLRGRTRAKLAEARRQWPACIGADMELSNFLSKKFGNVIQFKMVFRFLYISNGIAIPVATGKTPIITDHSCKTRNCLILEFDYLICNIRISAFIYIEFQYFVLLVEQKKVVEQCIRPLSCL